VTAFFRGMALMDRLERAFGRFALPGVSLYLIIGQVGVYLLAMLRGLDPSILVLVPELVRHGEPWRLVTFLFIPPNTNFIFIAFAWWMFFLMGNALEAYWGAFRYNLFLLLGYVLTVGLAFLNLDSVVTNEFLAGSVFLAFAYLNPEFEIMLFFILPVKIRWLALFAWAVYAASFVMNSWPARLQIIAAVGNFFIFFGRDLWHNAGIVTRRRRVASAGRAARAEEEDEPRHRCRSCGKTDRTDPQLDFRYCSKCAGSQCYCPDHIFNHEHVRSEDGSAPEN
jgi:hypothetical protein